MMKRGIGRRTDIDKDIDKMTEEGNLDGYN